MTVGNGGIQKISVHIYIYMCLYIGTRRCNYSALKTKYKVETYSLPDPLRIGIMFRAAPLTTRRKSLFIPTYLAYFCIAGRIAFQSNCNKVLNITRKIIIYASNNDLV